MSEAATWDRLAGGYERSVRLFDRSYPRVRELLRRDLAGRERVLEVAAGTGQFSLDLAAVAGEVTATDVSAAMVERLAARAVAAGLSNLSVAQRSAYDLEVESESLDGLVCANALHVMEEPERALAEFRRALRPGGLLVVPTFCHGIDLPRRVLSRFLGLVSPFQAHTRFTPASLREQVAGAGFRAREPELLPGLFPLAYLAAERP